MRKVSVVGYYDRGNCGDQALKSAVAGMLDPHASLTFTTPDEKGPLHDLAVMGGGDVIKPYFLERIKGAKDVRVLGAGLGYESELDLLASQKNVTEILFRNRCDAEAAKARGMNARYTPDIVFSLDVPTPLPVTRTPGKKLMGIMVADDISESYKQRDPQAIHYGNYLKNELALTLSDLRPYYRFVFIPMCHARYGYDVKMMYEVLNQIPPVTIDHEVMPTDGDPAWVMRAVAAMDVVLTMRFHGLIFSTLAGVPVVNIGVTRKTNTYMLENGLGDLSFDPYSLTRGGLLKRVALAEDPLTKIRVEQARDVNRQLAAETTEYVRREWLR